MKDAGPKESEQKILADAATFDEAGLAALITGRDDCRSAPPTGQPRVTNIHVYAEPIRLESLTNTDKASFGGWRLSKTLRAESELLDSLQPRRASQSSLTKLRCTLDPALSEFASLFSSFDRLAKTSFSKKSGELLSGGEEAPSWGGDEEKRDDGLPKRLGPQLFGPAAGEGRAYKRQHRRNAAAMQINTTGLGHLMADDAELAPPSKGPTILSPKPISPARQLRLKNSIPRLMKALPPLPGEAAEECDGVDHDALNRIGQSAARTLGGGGFPNKPFCDDDGARNEGSAARTVIGHCGIGASPRRFKVRVRTSPSPSQGSDARSLSGSLKQDRNEARPRASSAVKPKLKLKLSRSQLRQARRHGHGVSVFGSNRLKQCNSLADLAAQSGRRRYPGHGLVQDIAENRPRSAAGQGGWGPKDGNVEELDPSPQPSDPFSIPYPPSPDKVGHGLGSSASTNKATLSEMRSFGSDVNPAGHGGLRQKLSMFRLRFATTSTTAAASASKGGEAAGAAAEEDGSAPSAGGGDKCQETHGEGNGEPKGRAVSARSERVGGRVRRWANDAKEAVRSYVRRTLDRSSRLSG